MDDRADRDGRRRRTLPVLAATMTLLQLVAPWSVRAAAGDGDAASAVILGTGPNHGCAVVADRVSCWGSGSSGQLGDGSQLDRGSPVAVTGLDGADVVQLAGGLHHTCALLRSGAVTCWGANSDGQLGTGGFARALVPGQHAQLPAGRTATSIDAGSSTTCAVLDDGTLVCWGSNTYGQIGDGTTTTRARPTPVPMPGNARVTSVATGGWSTCALLEGGAVSCWGVNHRGQLGNGTTTTHLTPGAPIALPGGSPAVALAAGGSRACAVLTTGALACWGDNTDGALGDGTTIHRSTPVLVQVPVGTRASAVSTSSAHTCALLDDGRATCWGNDTFGQLGNGSTARSTRRPGVFVVVPPGSVLRAVEADGSSTCGVLTTGDVACAGQNFLGKLGTPGPYSAETPVVIARSASPTSVAATGGVEVLAASWAPAALGIAPVTGSRVGWTTEGAVACIPSTVVAATTMEVVVPPGSYHVCVSATTPIGDGPSAVTGPVEVTAAPTTTTTTTTPTTTTTEPAATTEPIITTTTEPIADVASLEAGPPERVLDTRLAGARAAAGAVVKVDVRSLAPRGATAVVVNLTATQAAAAGFLTAHACDDAAPPTSNLNHQAGVDVAALAVVALGDDDAVCVTTSAATHVLVDVVGWASASYRPATPTRLLDTRHAAAVAAGTTQRVRLPGAGSHVVTVTATRAAAQGHLAAWPCETGELQSRTVTFSPQHDAANATVLAGDELCVRASADVDVVVDHVGSFAGARPQEDRLVDTRRAGATRPAGSVLELPSIHGRLAFVNVTATGATADGFATVHACDEAPRTSNVNFRVGADVANLALVDPTARTCITIGRGSTHLVVDLVSVVP